MLEFFRQLFLKDPLYWDQLWCIGRKSERAYIRFYPNPGFMIPIAPNKRIRWSKFYGWMMTKAPKPGNPRGL